MIHNCSINDVYFFQDKSAVHKLFKVLVPRYQDYDKCYTTQWNPPRVIYALEDMKRTKKDIQQFNPMLCIELKGHPYPPLEYSNTKPNKKHIHNVLLSQARKELQSSKIE